MVAKVLVMMVLKSPLIVGESVQLVEVILVLGPFGITSAIILFHLYVNYCYITTFKYALLKMIHYNVSLRNDFTLLMNVTKEALMSAMTLPKKLLPKYLLLMQLYMSS